MATQNKLWLLISEFIPEIISMTFIKGIIEKNASKKADPGSSENKEGAAKPNLFGSFGQNEEASWILALNEISAEEASICHRFLDQLDLDQADRLKSLVGLLYRATENDSNGKIMKRGSTLFLERFSKGSNDERMAFCETLGGIIESDFQRSVRKLRELIEKHEDKIRVALSLVKNSEISVYHGPLGELRNTLPKGRVGQWIFGFILGILGAIFLALGIIIYLRG